MALALDGSSHASTNPGSGTSLPVTLTTSNAGDLICIIITTNGGPITGVTSPHLVFSRRSSSNPGNATAIEFWYAIAANSLSSETITVNNTSSGIITIDAFGVSGAEIILPTFDSNLSLPSFGVAAPLTINTSNPFDFIIEASRSNGGLTVDSGFTPISGADFQAVGYKIVSSAQTGLTITMDGASVNGIIADAIVQGIAGPHVTTTLTAVPGKHFTKKQYGDLLSEIRDEAIAQNQLLEGLSDKERADLDFDVARLEFEELESSLGPTNYAKAMDAKEKLDKARAARDHHYFMDIVNKEWSKYKESKKKQ